MKPGILYQTILTKISEFHCLDSTTLNVCAFYQSFPFKSADASGKYMRGKRIRAISSGCYKKQHLLFILAQLNPFHILQI